MMVMVLNFDKVISQATARNWEKLNTVMEGRLTSRANKRQSKKRILPLEYFHHLDNVSFVQRLLDLADLSEWSIFSVLLSLGINLFKRAKLLKADHVQTLLQGYQHIPVVEELTEIEIPLNEIDLIGLVYQSYLHEGDKNTIGSYYTPRCITKKMLRDFGFSRNETFFDPCCGSGSFLLAVDVASPDQLFGVDNDEIAVMIAKINLILKYNNRVFHPQVYCLDYLQESSLSYANEICTKKFDYIATNPPWGAMTKKGKTPSCITSNEPFSCFFVKSFRQLKKNGMISFLFPESVLNVKVHRDIRCFILDNCCLTDITVYDGLFTGVTTKYVDIKCVKKKQQPSFTFHDRDGSHLMEMSSLYETKNLVFHLMNETDRAILRKVRDKAPYSLRKSIWALGIVTGDNKNILSSVKELGMEPIFTGKEIAPYQLKPAKNYVVYDRTHFQQAAKDKIYRSPEKLVYKFISNKLVFAYDNTQSLFLNSANILIPQIPNMTIKTVLAFLNSILFQFMYIKMFGEVKILRGNLEELPFPKISAEDNMRIDHLVNDLLSGDSSKEAEIENAILGLYELSKEQILYIKGLVQGNVVERMTKARCGNK